MKYLVKKRFKALIAGENMVCKVGELVELDDQKLIKECKEKGLIQNVSIMDTNTDFTDEEFEELEANDDFNEFEGDDEFEEDNDDENVEYLSLEEIKKLKSKNDVIEYGQKLGLYELNDNFSRDELNEMVYERVTNLIGDNDEQI